MSTLGEQLKKIRVNLCYSQREFAKLLHIPNSALSYYENNWRKPSCKSLRKIMKYAKENGFDIQIKDLIDDDAANGKAANEE